MWSRLCRDRTRVLPGGGTGWFRCKHCSSGAGEVRFYSSPEATPAIVAIRARRGVAGAWAGLLSPASALGMEQLREPFLMPWWCDAAALGVSVSSFGKSSARSRLSCVSVRPRGISLAEALVVGVLLRRPRPGTHQSWQKAGGTGICACGCFFSWSVDTASGFDGSCFFLSLMC